MTTISGTGHRPDRLGGYSPQVRQRLIALATAALMQYEPEKVLSGVALGWDTALAIAAIDLNIPLVAVVPFKGQELRWIKEDQELYRGILSRAADVVYVCDGGYAAWKMQKRNEWMVDNCSLLLALWDGTESRGTANCVRYAQSKGVEVNNLWQSWAKYSGLVMR